MSDQNKGYNEIDDFAKALLEKKTEMALYKDINELKEETMSEWERLQAEEKMSSALDMLRKDRGQKTITEEEEEYDRKQATLQMPMDDEDDFTSEDLKDVKKPVITIRTEEVEEKQVEDASQKKEEKKKKKSKDKKPKDKKQKPVKEKKKMSKPLKIFLILMVFGFVLMGGYAYKVFVYDPANVASKEQLETYDKLIAYADEYDMMSDAEKLELLDMESDYDNMLKKQQSAINDYFKDDNHVGKSFNSTIKELKQLKANLEDESSKEFQDLKAFLEAWNNLSEEQRKGIVNHKSAYDGLNSVLQKKIDDIARTNCSKSFNALYQEYQTTINKQEEERKKANEAEVKQLQAQLDEEKSLLENYQVYGQSLDDELEYAKSQGLDTTETSDQIVQNNQMIYQCQQNIASLEAQIAALQ